MQKTHVIHTFLMLQFDEFKCITIERKHTSPCSNHVKKVNKRHTDPYSNQNTQNIVI